MRFAVLEVKIGVYSILSRFDLSSSDKTPSEVTLDPNSITASPKEPLVVMIRKRNLD